MSGWSNIGEHEQLDLQKARLEELIERNLVSPGMKNDLERLIDDISNRIVELRYSESNVLEAVGSH